MQKHITAKLSAYLNHELPKEERQTIAGHLLQCEKCRDEHDRIKLGVALASQLKRADAPENLWNEIESALDKKRPPRVSLIPVFSFFNSRASLATAAALLLGLGLISAVYFGWLKNDSAEVVRNTPPANQNAKVETPQIVSTPIEVLTNENANAQIPASANSNVTSPNPNLNVQIQPKETNSNVRTLPKINPIQPTNNQPHETGIAQNDLSAWNVETIAGTPTAGNQPISENGKLAVGQFLETDANSRARVQVSNIGQVEVAPNSRVQLIKTGSTEHRLSLEHGVLQAKILAPPRLFIVDTPSAVAVDLGCEYKLEVDKDGNSRLHVTSGYVALERNGRESIVPAGAICFTRRGLGLGTPFSDDASAEFQAALVKFDFENGGSQSLQTIIKEAGLYDSLTLWHLLRRVPKNEREKVFDALANYVKPPANATREGILRLDKKMLDGWWTEIEKVWFE
jgi:hypothetical protein